MVKFRVLIEVDPDDLNRGTAGQVIASRLRDVASSVYAGEMSGEVPGTTGADVEWRLVQPGGVSNAH